MVPVHGNEMCEKLQNLVRKNGKRDGKLFRQEEDTACILAVCHIYHILFVREATTEEEKNSLVPKFVEEATKTAKLFHVFFSHYHVKYGTQYDILSDLTKT